MALTPQKALSEGIECEYNNNSDIKLVWTTTGTRFTELIRLLSIFSNSKYPHPVHVKDSVISQPIGSKELFGTISLSSKWLSTDANNNPGPLNLFLYCSKNDLKRLKFNGADAVAIILNSQKNRYIFTDGNMRVEVDKSEYEELPSPPELNEERINNNRFKLDDRTVKSLKNMASKLSSCVLALYGDQLEKVKFNDVEEYCFTQENAIGLMGKQPDRILISHNIMKIVGNKDVVLSLKKDGDTYWLVTESTMNLDTKAIIYEQLV